MRRDEYIYHLEKDIRETTDSQFKETLEIVLKIFQLNSPIENELSTTVKEPFNPSPSQEKKFLWDKELLSPVSGRDLDTIHSLGFPNIVGMIKYTSRKNVYLTDNDETIVFSKSKYNSEYPNEAPMVGKSDEISLFNKCDWWLVARYEPNINEYKDCAIFDCRNLTVGDLNGDINFTSPHPDGTHIINKQTWFKVLGLQRREG